MIKSIILFDKKINGISVKDLVHELQEIEKGLVGKSASLVSVSLEDSVCPEDNIMRKSLVIKYRTKE